MNWKDRIEVNPAVLVGKPIIKGTRISVELILDRLADGWTMEDVLASYPHISREDVLAALSFASELFKGTSKNPNSVAIRRCSKNFNAYI